MTVDYFLHNDFRLFLRNTPRSQLPEPDIRNVTPTFTRAPLITCVFFQPGPSVWLGVHTPRMSPLYTPVGIGKAFWVGSVQPILRPRMMCRRDDKAEAEPAPVAREGGSAARLRRHTSVTWLCKVCSAESGAAGSSRLRADDAKVGRRARASRRMRVMAQYLGKNSEDKRAC